MRLPRGYSAVAMVILLGGTAPLLRAQDAAPKTSDTTRARPAVVKHAVKRGDTLWDIAKFYLKDPFKWPQVFHANTDIVKNPHWIYPGQVLTIEGGAVKEEVAAQVNDEGFVASRVQTRAQAPTVFTQETSGGEAPAASSIEKPQSLTVRPGEFEAAPYLIPEEGPTGAGKLVGATERMALGLSSDAGFRLNDRLYVTAPSGTALHVGDRVLVARNRRNISGVGRVVEPTGIVRVDSVAAGGPAIASLVRQFGTVVPDQMILPLDGSFQETTVRPARGAYPLTGKLLWIQNNPALASIQTYVIIGAGQAAGVKPGDQFTLFDDASASVRGNVQPVAVGLVKIVRVTPLGASGLIVDQSQPHIREGMPTHLTAKMP